jgi:hypothetical protein
MGCAFRKDRIYLIASEGSAVAERRVKIAHQGQLVDGYDVPILESNERWSELKLEDGTTLRVKLSVITVTRPDNQYDPTGNPMYIINATPTMAVVDVPDKLKRKTN